MFVADLLRTRHSQIQVHAEQNCCWQTEKRHLLALPDNQKRSTRIRYTLIRYLPSEPQPTASREKLRQFTMQNPENKQLHISSTPSTLLHDLRSQMYLLSPGRSCEPRHATVDAGIAAATRCGQIGQMRTHLLAPCRGTIYSYEEPWDFAMGNRTRRYNTFVYNLGDRTQNQTTTKKTSHREEHNDVRAGCALVLNGLDKRGRGAATHYKHSLRETFIPTNRVPERNAGTTHNLNTQPLLTDKLSLHGQWRDNDRDQNSGWPASTSEEWNRQRQHLQED